MKYLALTFDDGVNFKTTVPILDILENFNSVGTFFVCGKHLNDDTKPILTRAYNLDCEIANHSYSHRNMTELSQKDILSEIDMTSNLIFNALGEYPKFFRPPYIAINQTMFDIINLPFICGYGCNDWDNNVSVEDRIHQVLERSQDGNIILLHDLFGNDKTVQALEFLVPKLKSMDFELVTVSKLFEIKKIIPSLHDNKLYSNVENPTICSW